MTPCLLLINSVKTYAGIMREQQLAREHEQTLRNIRAKESLEPSAKEVASTAAENAAKTKRRNRWDVG